MFSCIASKIAWVLYTSIRSIIASTQYMCMCIAIVQAMARSFTLLCLHVQFQWMYLCLAWWSCSTVCESRRTILREGVTELGLYILVCIGIHGYTSTAHVVEAVEKELGKCLPMCTHNDGCEVATTTSSNVLAWPIDCAWKEPALRVWAREQSNFARGRWKGKILSYGYGWG